MAQADGEAALTLALPSGGKSRKQYAQGYCLAIPGGLVAMLCDSDAGILNDLSPQHETVEVPSHYPQIPRVSSGTESAQLFDLPNQEL